MSNNNATQLYLENPQSWEPGLESQEVLPDRPSSFYAVVMPEQQTEIPNWEAYQELMIQRVTWTMEQELEDPNLEVDDLLKEIVTRLNQDRIDIPLPRESQNLEDWARALVEAPRMRRLWGSTGHEFPLMALSQPEDREWAISVVQSQTFEEWLLLYTKE